MNPRLLPAAARDDAAGWRRAAHRSASGARARARAGSRTHFGGRIFTASERLAGGAGYWSYWPVTKKGLALHQG